MTLERQQRIIVIHPATIVDHANQPLSARFRLHPNRVAPASSAFSTNSFTTDAGLSTTSPAAILLAIASGSMRICDYLLADSSYLLRFFNRIPNSLNCSFPTPEGDSAIRSCAAVVFGNAITSRIDFSPAINITTRSIPSAIPPCGGVP